MRDSDPTSTRRRVLLPGTVLALQLLLTACSEGMSGTYQDELGFTRYEFVTDGTVYMSVMGMRFAGEYELDGNRVVVRGPNGTIVLERQGDALYGPMGLALTPVRR